MSLGLYAPAADLAIPTCPTCASHRYFTRCQNNGLKDTAGACAGRVAARCPRTRLHVSGSRGRSDGGTRSIGGQGGCAGASGRCDSTRSRCDGSPDAVLAKRLPDRVIDRASQVELALLGSLIHTPSSRSTPLSANRARNAAGAFGAQHSRLCHSAASMSLLYSDAWVFAAHSHGYSHPIADWQENDWLRTLWSPGFVRHHGASTPSKLRTMTSAPSPGDHETVKHAS